MVGDVSRLRPHIKTNKSPDVAKLMLKAGITKFKCATIAEAEMLAMIQAPDVLLAYPPEGPKIKRLIRLIQKYPDTKFSCLTDHADSVKDLSLLFSGAGLTASVYIDLNLGMNRTGIQPENATKLYQQIISLPSNHLLGLHAYDGNIRDHDEKVRAEKCRQAFIPVLTLKKELEKLAGHPMTLIAGGSPTGLIHAAAGGRECSPGTFVFWKRLFICRTTFRWAAL
jgi:D-serine deaminase-like pyridoxal phosphate-dependent protein